MAGNYFTSRAFQRWTCSSTNKNCISNDPDFFLLVIIDNWFRHFLGSLNRLENQLEAISKQNIFQTRIFDRDLFHSTFTLRKFVQFWLIDFHLLLFYIESTRKYQDDHDSLYYLANRQHSLQFNCIRWIHPHILSVYIHLAWWRHSCALTWLARCSSVSGL